MKNLLLILSIIIVVGCKSDLSKSRVVESSKTETVSEKENFDWLLGKWKRVHDDDGKQTFEEWKKVSSTEYQGIGYVMENDKNQWQENLKLKKGKNGWSLEVQMPSEKNPTVFKFTSFDQTSFVCENPDNEFPKMIKYFMDEEKLKAEIMGDDMLIPFEFMRTE